MKIILKENEEAEVFFEDLINKMAERVTHRIRRALEDVVSQDQKESLWVTTEEAKQILGIKSKKKMQQLRDESPFNGIVLSKNGRTYLYNRESLHQYLQKNIVK